MDIIKTLQKNQQLWDLFTRKEEYNSQRYVINMTGFPITPVGRGMFSNRAFPNISLNMDIVRNIPKTSNLQSA